MKKMLISRLAVVLTLGIVAMAAENAQAQIQFGPNGDIGFPNAFGGYTWIHPQRLNPFANIPVTPGQSVPGMLGQVYGGLDGKLHGDLLDPTTGDRFLFSNRSGAAKSAGFIEESGSNSSAVAQPKANPNQKSVPAVLQPQSNSRQTFTRGMSSVKRPIYVPGRTIRKPWTAARSR